LTVRNSRVAAAHAKDTDIDFPESAKYMYCKNCLLSVMSCSKTLRLCLKHTAMWL